MPDPVFSSSSSSSMAVGNPLGGRGKKRLIDESRAPQVGPRPTQTQTGSAADPGAVTKALMVRPQGGDALNKGGVVTADVKEWFDGSALEKGPRVRAFEPKLLTGAALNKGGVVNPELGYNPDPGFKVHAKMDPDPGFSLNPKFGYNPDPGFKGGPQGGEPSQRGSGLAVGQKSGMWPNEMGGPKSLGILEGGKPVRYLTGAVPNFLLPEPITEAPPKPGPKGHSDLSYHFRVEPGVLSKQGQPPSLNPFVESPPAEEDRSEKWFAMEGEPARPGLQTLEWRPGDRKEHIAELRDLLDRQEWAPHELGQRQQLVELLRGAEAKRDEPKSMIQTAELRSSPQTKVQRPEDMAVPAVDRRDGVAKPLVSPAVAEPLGAEAKSDTPVPGAGETPPANAMEPKPLPPPVLTGDLADPLPELPLLKGDRGLLEKKLRESEARARELLLPLLRKRVGLGFDASLVGEMLNTILDIEAGLHGVGDLVAPADAKKTEAEALQKRLENLEQQGGLSAGDVNELFTSNKQGKELAEYILQLRGAIKRDDQANETAQKILQQQEAAQRDAEQLEMSPQAWAQQHQKQLGQLKGPELEAYLQQTQAAYDRRVQGINEGYETLNKQMRALDEEGQALIAENEERLAEDGIPPNGRVHPDLVGRFQSHNARLRKWQQEATATQAKLKGEEELVKTQGEQLQAGFDRYGTQAKETRQGELAQLRQQPLPGAGFAADEYQELETQVDSRRAALDQQVREGSLSPQEAQSAGAALDEELRTGRQAVQQRLTERLEKTAVTLQALTKEKDPEAARAAAVEKLAAEVKLTPEQAETLLADLEARDWTRYLPSQGEKEPGLTDVLSQDSRRVRVLSTGAVVVNPALAANPEEYIAAVKSAPATEEAKQAALARMQEARREWVRGVAGQLHAESRIPGLPSYMEWMQEEQQRDQAEQGGRGFLKLSEEDRLLRYVDTMRKRPEWEKYADTSLRSLFSGGGAVGASLVGVAGMVVDLSPAGQIMKRLGINAGEEISEVAKKWDESNQAITAGLQAKGGLDTLGLKGASILASVVPQAGAMFMGGAVVKGSKLAMGLLEAAQSAGQVYVERYGELRRQGMSHADAWKQAAPHALGAGLTTGVISLVVGKAGEEGLKKLGQALTTPAMRQVLKEGLGEQMVRVAGLTKEAALQFAEEMADNLGQNVLAKEAKGEEVDIMQIVTETLQQSPETLTSVIGMMGVTKGAGGSKHSIGGTAESVPRLDASSVAGYAGGGSPSPQGQAGSVVPPVSFSRVQSQGGLPLATSQLGPAPAQAPGQPNQSSAAEVASPPTPANPSGQSGPVGSVPPPLPQAGVQPGAAPPTQPGQAPSTLAEGNPSGGTPQPISYTPPTSGTDPQGNPSARGESTHPLSENNGKQQPPMENGGTPPTQVSNPDAPHQPPTDQPGTPAVNTPPTQVPNQEAPHLPPTDPSGKPVVNTPPTQVPNQEAPHQPPTDPSGVPQVNAPPVRPPDAPPPIWQGTARHGDHAEVLSRNPNGTFQVRIRGQEQTRTERDVAYMTGMNKPALYAHLDGVTQSQLARGQAPSGPPIWQGTARHGDYAEVLSRNPNGTFQVRIRGQEQTRTERDVAYMTGMNKPALDAHLEGVTAGRQNPSVNDAPLGSLDTVDSASQVENEGSVFANIPPPNGRPRTQEWVDPKDVTYWDQRLAGARVRDPVDYTDVLGNSGANLGPLNRLQVHRAIQSFLNLIPGDIVRAIGSFELYAYKTIIDENGKPVNARGEWHPGNRGKTNNPARQHGPVIKLTYDLATSEYDLRSTIWHEMTHWLWDNADKHPRLEKWRADLEQHFAERTAGEEKLWDSEGGYFYWKDGWIENYSGRDYPGQTPGVELPTTYMQLLSGGGTGVARWQIHEDAISTFELVMSILGDTK